jgi:hypothetical protein
MLHRGVIYLTGVRNAETDAMVTYYGDMLPLGMMVTPIFTKSRESYERYVPLYNWIGIDNGCFSRPDAFHLKSYLGMISRVAGMTERISFATAPDVFDITAGRGNWPATLAKSLPVLPLIRKAGAPAAIVLQDGATSKTVPWGEIDAVFVGASTRWKLSEACRQICIEARRGDAANGYTWVASIRSEGCAWPTDSGVTPWTALTSATRIVMFWTSPIGSGRSGRMKWPQIRMWAICITMDVKFDRPISGTSAQRTRRF